MLLYVQDEPSTIHWDHAQATVHPTSLFYVCPNPTCNKIVREDLIHISPDKDHYKYAVKKFFETCVMHLTKKNIPIQEFIIFTDNCVGQYKSKFVFYWMSKLKQPCTHHFYTPKYGKGPSDRAGGAFKKKIRNYVKAKGVLLSTEDIENYCRRNYDHQVKCGDEDHDEGNDHHDLSKGPHTLVKVIDRPHISRPSTVEKLCLIPGTRDYLNAIRNTGIEGILQHRYFDCCCYGCVTHSLECSQQGYGDKWKVSSVLYGHSKKFLKNLELPKDWFKPLCNPIHEMSDKEISEVHRDEIHVTMHERSDEEIDEERDEEIDEERQDEIHVTMDKQIESSDDEKDESDLSGIEPLDDEADVLITEIEEYITSEEEMNEIAFANNDTEESRCDVEVDESIDFDWKKILHEMQNFKTYAELKEFVFEKQPLFPPPSVKMKYYLDSHDKICKVANNF